MTNYINLDRKFVLLPEDAMDESSISFQHARKLTWESLLLEYRTVILAEAGAGKTVEFMQCANSLQKEGRFSFFIRIEDIDRDFIEAFEIGDEDTFEEWLDSADEAWFFLDSVDEARLEDPRQFHKAIRNFARKIKPAFNRAHIYISCRLSSGWQYESDKKLLNDLLFLSKNDHFEEEIFSVKNNDLEDVSVTESSLNVYVLCPLESSDIDRFCHIREVLNIGEFIYTIERLNLINLAARPFDLENLIKKWSDDAELGSRLGIFEHSVASRLKEDHACYHKSRNISYEILKEGAQRLAAAVVLSGKNSINVPKFNGTNKQLDASNLLPKWNENEIRWLLETGVFNGVIYGAVRFRHRETREYLAAKWFFKLLQGDNRLAIESLFFRKQFGINIITPTLRPILPWLVLFDEKICHRVMEIQPELIFESGDPANLVLSVRKKILLNIVERIASNLDDRFIRHNDSIEKIANIDLEEDVFRLIQKYSDNNDVIFFLARLVWLGNMKKCVPLLSSLALDADLSLYSRSVCIRSVMSCGERVEKINLWKSLNKEARIKPLNRQIVTELIKNIELDEEMIQLLLISLEKAENPKKYEHTGLSYYLEIFIDKCNVELSFELLKGFSKLLLLEPHYEYQESKISKKYAWLLKPSLHLIIQLIKNRSEYAFDSEVFSILINCRCLDYQRGIQGRLDYNIAQERQRLKILISDWSKLHDALYWNAVGIVRESFEKDDSWKEDRIAQWICPFLNFEMDGFERFIGYIESKASLEDKKVAFDRAYGIYTGNDKPERMLSELQTASSNHVELASRLKIYLNPVQCEESIKWEKQDRQRELEQEKERIEEEIARNEWIQSLREYPNQILSSSFFLSGELTKNHLWLMYECGNENDHQSWGSKYTNWQALIPKFGEEVARAYREAMIQFWRIYKPGLHSEEVLEKNKTPYAVIFALTGLEIESRENKDFPNYLQIPEVENALRYITWEINGFPSWFEKFYKKYPTESLDALMKEITWVLENELSETSSSSLDILFHDLVYYTPWIHNNLAPKLFDWFLENDTTQLSDNLRKYAFEVLLNSGVLYVDQFRTLAEAKLEQSFKIEDKAFWYALFVDSDPERGIPDFENWLAKQKIEDAIVAAQFFITCLMGNTDRMDRKGIINGRAGQDKIKFVKYLKQIYMLMHRYIKIEDDINRANGGTYSPELRDYAQDSRDLIFEYLRAIYNSESYYAIKELASLPENESRQVWMNQAAYNIALFSGDLEAQNESDILELELAGAIDPKTHKELFRLAMLRLKNIKDWLENGDDSPFLTWQKANNETEMRNLIAAELRKSSQNKYSVSQEHELANGQRPDIRLDNSQVASPVSIELKLLDKSWTGPMLCERLRNQLVGDYLREETARCGIFLLVSKNTDKKWQMDGKQVGLDQLEQALQNYWQKNIAPAREDIDSIEVIVIDLNKRSRISGVT